jgi:uncharacterized membrane protein YidH (DUF202 family)
MKKILISLGSIVSFSLPVLVLAETNNPNLTYPTNFINQATSLTRMILIFLISLSVVWFIWNVIRYTMAEDEEGKGKAKQQMIWGIIAIAVTVSVWGLVNILRTAFGVNSNTGAPTLDNMIPGGSSSNSTPIPAYQSGVSSQDPFNTEPLKL